MLKIAYELAYLELGRKFLDDEVGQEVRKRLQTIDLQPGIATGLRVTAGFGPGIGQPPTPRTWHRLTLLTNDEQVVADVRIFNVLHFTTVISDRASAYPDFDEFAIYLLDARRRHCFSFMGDDPEEYCSDLLAFPP